MKAAEVIPATRFINLKLIFFYFLHKHQGDVSVEVKVLKLDILSRSGITAEMYTKGGGLKAVEMYCYCLLSRQV